MFNVTKFISEHFKLAHTAWPELRFCCPFCKETRFRCYVNTKLAKNLAARNSGWCHNESRAFSVIELVAEVLSLTYSQAYSLVYSSLGIQLVPSDLSAVLADKLKSKDCDLSLASGLSPVKLPSESRSLSWATPMGRMACKYLRERGVPVSLARRLGIRYCATGLYHTRLIFPVRDIKGNVVYFTNRSMLRTVSKRKSLHPHKQEGFVSRNDVLFNIDRACRHDTVLITEGPFDALLAGENAVALLGKSLSRLQRETLLLCEFKRYVVMLDGDAYADSVKIGKLLMPYGDTYVVKLPEDKDPADLAKEGGLLNFLDGAEKLTLQTIIKKRLDGLGSS